MLHLLLTIAVLVQGMEPDIDMLAGEALMVTGGADTTVVHFPVSAMPCQPAARFAMLFERQPRWQWEHLKPYLKGLQVGRACVQVYLLSAATLYVKAQLLLCCRLQGCLQKPCCSNMPAKARRIPAPLCFTLPDESLTI